MKSLVIVAALLTASCATPNGQDPVNRTAFSILARMKAACGGDAWDRVQGWHETGLVDLPGRAGMAHEIWHDMRTLKTAMVNRVDGRTARHAGFNGSTYWQVGADGRVETGNDPARLRKHRRDAYLSSSGWFFPDRFPAAIAVAGTQNVEGRMLDVLRISPVDADDFELWVDRQTHRIRRIVAGNEYAELSDYKMFGDLCSATTGRQGNGDPAQDIVLHVRTIKTDARVPAATFNPPSGG